MPLVNKKKVLTFPLPKLSEVLPLPLPSLPSAAPPASDGSAVLPAQQTTSTSTPAHNIKHDGDNSTRVEIVDELAGLAHPTPDQAIAWLDRARIAQARLIASASIPLNGKPAGRRRSLKAIQSDATRSKMVARRKGDRAAAESNQVEPTEQDGAPDKADVKPEFELSKWKEPEVWYIEKTGEMFWTYEAYADRVSFYRQKVFQGETSTAHDLIYYDALTADLEESRSLHRAFPEQLKGPILRAVQFHVEGRLDDLTDEVYDRFANRYFINEKVFVHLDGDKYLAHISAIFPPATLTQSSRKGVKSEPGSAAAPVQPHSLGCDLRISSDKAIVKDDPSDYEYLVQLVTQENIDASVHFSMAEDATDKWGARSFRVPADQLHRDRIQLSKTNLKRFLKDCLDRDSLAYSPWLVKPILAQMYGVDTDMSEKTRNRLEEYRESKMEQRKRQRNANEDEDELADAPAPKKTKKVIISKEERARAAEEERLKQEEEDRLQEEEERKKRRKPTKFPAEDLLLEHTLHEKRHEKPVLRPIPSTSLPFPGHFEVFLSTWSFLNSMAKPLELSQFTIDQFENALYSSDPQTMILLAEVHAVLLNAIRRDHVEHEQPRVYPLKAFEPVIESDDSETRESSLLDSEDDLEDSKMKLVSQACLDHMETWEQRELAVGNGRRDWQKSLVGCLWARGMVSTLPNLLTYMRHLLLEDDRNKPGSGPRWVAEPSLPKLAKRLDYRYATLNHVFRLEIIAFLCELVMQTKVCRDAFDESTNAVTRCRVEQNDVRRELRRLHAELDALEPKAVVDCANADGTDVDMNGEAPEGSIRRSSASPSVAGTGPDRDDPDRTGQSGGESDSEADSNAENKRGKASALRQKLLSAQQAQREAEQAKRKAEMSQAAEHAKAKRLEGKALAAEKSRLQEEITDHDQQLEELERDFRRQCYYLRMSPLGQDRFGNKVWWFDGCGSADICEPDGSIIYGTGRIYIQGGSPSELARRAEEAELTPEELEEKRSTEETAEGFIPEGDWAIFDTPQQFSSLCRWLNGKGVREAKLLDAMRKWEYAIEGGMRKRLQLFDVERAANGDADTLGKRVRRPAGTRAEPLHRGREAYLDYKNHLAGK